MTESSIEILDAAAFAAATGATEAQMGDMERFRALLAEWNTRFNLVGPSALETFWPRHAWDSAQLLKRAPEALTWADLGAGAGFPGIVIAILLKGRDGARVHLVESMEKRCTFLRAVVEALDLPAQVRHARAEDGAVAVDVVTARACAPMTRLLRYAKPWLVQGAKGLFLKGGNVDDDLRQAAEAWSYAWETVPSLSDPSGRVVIVTRPPREKPKPKAPPKTLKAPHVRRT